MEKSEQRNAHKLAILLARKSHWAVILRRGPSAWFHVTKWDLAQDKFEFGAWFRGRIYQSKCDVSDDGKYFLYSAHQGRKLGTSYTDSYTALSTAPWLKAHALWPQGSTYLGGGRFNGTEEIGIYTLPFMQPIHPDHRDTKGFRVSNLTTFETWHDDECLVEDADWSKHDLNCRIIWHKNYAIYIRENGEDRLVINLDHIEPNPQPAPY